MFWLNTCLFFFSFSFSCIFWMLCAIDRIVSSFSAFFMPVLFSFWKLRAFLSSPKCASFRFALFCSRFFLQKIGNLLSFSILGNLLVRKFLLLCFLCIVFFTGHDLHLFVEYTSSIPHLVFIVFVV